MLGVLPSVQTVLEAVRAHLDKPEVAGVRRT
jgi:hypothetical protein